ncbi:MAG: methylenetetrahydrofolate reductase [Synergistota bacterium]|nr:methylenetetrahydrofolate reductase [Synergistota bacterium]
MKVTDRIKQKKILSIEVLPPSRGQNINEIFEVIDNLAEFPIDFINVTRHPAEIDYLELPDGIVKAPRVRRPGTVGVTAALMKRYDIDVAPHILCYGMDRDQIEDTLIDLNLLGVDNIFVLRGEYESSRRKEAKSAHENASGLVRQVRALNRGEYLYPCDNAIPADFCIGVAAYPEKHYEAANLEDDLKHFREKAELGAGYAITQMFFDANRYKQFVERVREAGVDIPVIPGIKPIANLRSLYNIPKKFFVDIPNTFLEEMQKAGSAEKEFETGAGYMADLAGELLDFGAPGIHVFTMGRGKSTRALLERLYPGEA